MPKTVTITRGCCAIGLELAAQIHDVRVDRAIERVVVLAERRSASSARVNARPGARRQHLEQSELRRRHRHERRRAGAPSRDVRSISTLAAQITTRARGRVRRSTAATRATSSRGLNGLVT